MKSVFVLEQLSLELCCLIAAVLYCARVNTAVVCLLSPSLRSPRLSCYHETRCECGRQNQVGTLLRILIPIKAGSQQTRTLTTLANNHAKDPHIDQIVFFPFLLSTASFSCASFSSVVRICSSICRSDMRSSCNCFPTFLAPSTFCCSRPPLSGDL